MNNIIAFDLSTTCTGVVIATVAVDFLMQLETLAIIPEDIDIASLGFLKTKQKIKTTTGGFLSYVKTKGELVSKAEAKRRSAYIRKTSETNRISTVNKEIDQVIKKFLPRLVLMEANMAFRSMSVTRQLAEVAGGLQALAASNGAAVEKINVHSARTKWNTYFEMRKFAKLHTEEELKHMDVLKETLKSLVLAKYKNYGLNADMTTDESDAIVILDHYFARSGIRYIE